MLSFIATSCNLDEIAETFTHEPPVSPISQTIKTSTLAGFASAVCCSHFSGYNVPFAEISFNQSTTIFHINIDKHFPFRFSNDVYGQMEILCIRLDDKTAILSILLSDSDISSGRFSLFKIHTFPILFFDGSIKAVFASQDINFGPDNYLEISVNESEIQFEINRLEQEIPFDEYIAIEQNAWFVEIDQNNTWLNFDDDIYIINGGQQNVSISTFEDNSNAQVIQLAIINSHISPECSKNPVSGFSVMQSVETEKNIVIGQSIFYFQNNCSGKIKLLLGTGSFIGSSGKNIDLNL